MNQRIAAVRAYLLETHTDLLEGVLACADETADSWNGDATADRAAVVEPFEHRLDTTGIVARLPEMLVGAVEALGESLPATPVAAPPYVTVTSRGPVLRATLEPGRLVVTVQAFEVDRDPTRYVRGATDPADALDVVLKAR